MDGVVRGARSIDPPLAGSVITLGAFDGVHLGHQALIERAVQGARAAGVPAVGYTFYPHPAAILSPAAAPKRLMSVQERAARMRSLGLDLVIVEPFDKAFAEVTADDFVEQYLVDRLHPRRVVVGFNFNYGKGRGGGPVHLRAAGARFGFEVDVVEPVHQGGAVASSTRIRSLLTEGRLEEAAVLLGRDFEVVGVVGKGDQRGRTIGFPTANVEPEQDILPAPGVYATRVELLDDAHAERFGRGLLPAVTNIGRRPTFSGQHVTVESFLLGFSGDLYGARLRLHLVRRLREERKFDGVDALVAQVKCDATEAARTLGVEPSAS